MRTVPGGSEHQDTRRTGVGAATVFMAIWVLALLLVWAPGLLEVPSFGPWCDYSHPRTESHIDSVFREGSVWTVHDHVETAWTPPGVRCADASSPLDEHGHYPIVGNTQWAAALQLLLFAIPPLVWWAPPRSESDIAVHRRAAVMMAAGGIGLSCWGLFGLIVGSVNLAAVYVAVGVALMAFSVFYRRTHGAEAEGQLRVPIQTPTRERHRRGRAVATRPTSSARSNDNSLAQRHARSPDETDWLGKG
jgi:hypothetical protein